MNSASIHVRLSPDLKQQFEQTLAPLGLGMSEAIKLFVTRVVAEKSLPFMVKVPNAALAQTIHDADQGVGLIGPFDDVAAVMRFLDDDTIDDDA
ncbi:MAG: type II toxin-antitoxin system RelB/DinJ family antitoxin [Chloroflexota bacterium]|jgi:DNA-damage-inducible protein J